MTARVNDVDALVDGIEPGVRIGMSGFQFTRAPVAAIRALAASKAKELHYIAWGGGPLEIMLDLALVAMATPARLTTSSPPSADGGRVPRSAQHHRPSGHSTPRHGEHGRPAGALRLDSQRRRGPARRAHRKLAGQLVTDTTAHWLELLDANDVRCAPVQDHAALEREPQVEHAGLVWKVPLGDNESTFRTVGSPFTFSKTPASARYERPRAGQHTDEIFNDITR